MAYTTSKEISKTMEPFKINILGCGSAIPTLRHNPASQIIELRGKTFMVDCGEGTQIQIRKQKVHFAKIQAIFISHLHGDHCFGLWGMISTFGLTGRTSPLHIYAPKQLEEYFYHTMQLFGQGFSYDVIFHPIDATCKNTIYEDKSLTVTTIPLKHRMPCCGFLFKEKPTLPHINRSIIDFYNIPISQFNNIKNGANWQTPEGKIIPNSILTTPADTPKSYAYCSDTRYMENLYKQVANVTLLYHESTYNNEDKNKAEKYFHSTAKEAAMVAKAAKVKQLLLGHYSARYSNEELLLEEAKEIFPNTILSFEGLCLKI